MDKVRVLYPACHGVCSLGPRPFLKGCLSLGHIDRYKYNKGGTVARVGILRNPCLRESLQCTSPPSSSYMVLITSLFSPSESAL